MPVVFCTEEGIVVPAITADEMLEVDRLVVEEFGLGLLQMMENAGRNLAENALDMLGGAGGEVTILAGAGGNGGGGLACARHLHNQGVTVWLALDRDGGTLAGAAAVQLHILQAAGLAPANSSEVGELVRRSALVVDALIGYSLRGVPRGRAAELIHLCNQSARRVLALDVPSGLNATTGETPGAAVRPERTLTLALPKTGLAHVSGDLYLADIGIPPEVFHRLGLIYQIPFKNCYWPRLLNDKENCHDPT